MTIKNQVYLVYYNEEYNKIWVYNPETGYADSSMGLRWFKPPPPEFIYLGEL